MKNILCILILLLVVKLKPLQAQEDQHGTPSPGEDYFAKFEELMLGERSRQAVEVLENDFAADRFKEIEITCPGEVSPLVKIRDLIAETSFSSNERRECSVIKLTGKNFNFRMALYCDDKENAKFDFTRDV